MGKSALVSVYNRQLLQGGAKMFGNALQHIKKNDKCSSYLQEGISDVNGLMPMEKLNYVVDSGNILPPKPSEMVCPTQSYIQNSLSPPTTDLPVYSSEFQFPESLIDNLEQPIIFPPIPLEEATNESPELCSSSPSPSFSSDYQSSQEIPFEFTNEQIYISPPMPKTSTSVDKLSYNFEKYLFLKSSDSSDVSATQTTVGNEEEPIIFPPIPLEMINKNPELCISTPSPSGYLSLQEIPFDNGDEQVYIPPPIPKTSSSADKLSCDFEKYPFLSSSDSSNVSATQTTFDKEEEPVIFPPIPLEMINESPELCISSPSPSGYLSSQEIPLDYADEQVYISSLLSKTSSQEDKLNNDFGNNILLLSPSSNPAYVSAIQTTNDNEEEPVIKEASGDRSSQKSTKWSPSVESLLSFNAESFIDTHCHLDLLLEKKQFQGNYADYLRENKQDFPLSYEGCITVFCEPLLFKKYRVWTKQLIEENAWASFGCHPKYAKYYNDRIEKDLVNALTHLKVRALGEIGLDYSEECECPADKQKDVFRRQIKIAMKKKFPLVIHCREAYDDCLTIMKEMLPEDYPIHLHCFTGQWKTAEKYLSVFSKMCIGITNLVTLSSATEVHEVAQKTPLDRILLETDAPFFVPSALSKETSIADPGMAIFVAEKIAQLRNISLREVLYQTRRNTEKVYDI